MEQRLTLITLGVKDLTESSAFYEDIFGWKRSPFSNDNISFFELNGMMLSLFPKDKLAEDAGVENNGKGFAGITLAYNTKSEKEVDSLVNELRSKGVKVVKEPQKVFWGGYSSYISDPNGYLWEIAYNPFMEI